jgi:uncharacterized protein YgiM (DUF1202 family)
VKRLGIVLLLAAIVLGQVSWLALPAQATAQEGAGAADDAATQTAIAEASNQTATAGAAAQTAIADAAMQTAVADAATQTALADAAIETARAGAAQTAAAGSATQTAGAEVGGADVSLTETVAAAVPSATATPPYKNIYPGDTIQVNTGTLNVRLGPSTTADVVAQVRSGQRFVVLDGPIRAGSWDWIRIDMGTSPADERWVAAQYVIRVSGPAPTATNTATPSSTATATNTAAPTSTPTATSTIDPLATATFTPTETHTPAPTSTRTSTPAYKDIDPGDTIQINTGTLNVRRSTSTSSQIVAQVLRGQQYLVLEGPIRTNGYDWIRIDMGASTSDPRWIAAQYVILVATPATATPTSTPDGSATATSTPNGSATATNTPAGTVVAGTYLPGNTIVVRTSLNVRSGPSTGSGILRVVSPGTQGVVETGNTPGGTLTWINVRFGSTVGWVAITYVQHLSLTTPTPAPGSWLLSLSLDCFSSPERITLVNSSSSPAQIISITTHFDRGADEPWVLNHTLSGQQTRSYLMGTGASGSFALTDGFRLTDSAGTQEGVTVETSFGTLSRSCPASSSGERWVEVDLSDQYMVVYQGSVAVAGTYVSTGKPGFDTPVGTFRTWVKYVSTRMAACSNGECWDTPNVPFTHFFTYNGHALHGAYWHNEFGRVRSHGCVNLPVPFSEWLYYWLPLGSRVVVKR